MATIYGSRGIFGVGMIRLKSKAVLGFSGSGAPTDGTSGTGAGLAPIGSEYLDTATGFRWFNVGTTASPVWSTVSIIYRNVTVTTAQVLALNATPVSLVPAPGANKALIFEEAMISKAAGTAYGGIAAGEDLAIKYTDASGLDVGQVEMTGFADSAGAQFRLVKPVVQGTAPVASFTPVANAALVAHMVVGEITTGTSDFKFRVFYRIVPTVL